MTDFLELSLKNFNCELSSKAAVPGGGGASALVGAIGTALGSMVGSLTVGKKKYADVEADVRVLMERAEELRARLESLVNRDAEVFAPLAAAYSLPKETEEQRAHKAQVMEAALKEAAQAPLEVMRACAESLKLLEGFANMGSMLAISDAGVGAAFCRAALVGADFNVRINTAAMQDRTVAAALDGEADEILQTYCPMADAICALVREKIAR